MREIFLLPIFLTLSILLSNNSLVELSVNDAPIWLDIPEQTISEDCEDGCIDNIFSIIDSNDNLLGRFS